MPNRLDNCIYCGKPFCPLKGQGDHVLPSRVFGEFRGDRPFRGVCTSCNNDLGRFEQQVAQASPLGFYRWVVKPNLGRRKHRGDVRQRGALGAPAPRFTATFGSTTVLAFPSSDNPLDLDPVDQVVIVDTGGKEHQIRLFPGMSAQRLRCEIEQLGVGDLKEAWFQCDPSVTDQYKALVAQVYPATKIAEEGQIQPGDYRVPTRIDFQVTDAYFQAIAKIAFHYYLVRNRRGFRGSEPVFAELRDFIRNGGDARRFFRTSGRKFEVPFGRTSTGGIVTPKGWCHLFAADETEGMVVVYLQLFVGPQSLPPPTYVTLGEIDSRIVLPTGVWGHVFEYDSTPRGRYAGRVVEASFTPVQRPLVR
jgi:hypothetical protein